MKRALKFQAHYEANLEAYLGRRWPAFKLALLRTLMLDGRQFRLRRVKEEINE